MNGTILIIEDEEDILALLSAALGSEGYNVVTASNGREGIEQFQEHNPDLVITDVKMPVMNGIEVLREIKTKDSDADVIILTGHSDESTAIDCLRHGAYDYYRKPLEDIDVLLAAVNRVLDKRKLELKNRILVKQLEELSIKDPLTGLYNYRHLHNCLDEEIDRSERYGHTFLALMIDIDHFKNVNDTCGHLFGDYILKKLGKIILHELRASDRLFRYGGEEFFVVMNEISKKEAVTAVNRLIAAIRSHTFISDGQQTKITVSMGGSCFPGDARDKRRLIKLADQALYRAKEMGRDRVEFNFELPEKGKVRRMEELLKLPDQEFEKSGGPIKNHPKPSNRK